MMPTIFSIADIVKIVKIRQKNKFDANIVVTGARGDGKSTLVGKIFFRLDGFNPQKHMVFNRKDVINLLRNQKFGLAWDDEAIRSGYKRKFQNQEQQELIETVTMYRDNFNIYATVLPNFFSLDKDLRDMFFMHIQVIERGIAVVHMPLRDTLYNQDKWDANNNGKIERAWVKRRMKNPNFKTPYHQLTTFRGYLKFQDLTPKQRKLIDKIKFEKRRKASAENDKPTELPFIEKVYNLLIDGKLNNERLLGMCLAENKKFNSIKTILNAKLKDNGETKTLKDYLVPKKVEQDFEIAGL